MAIDIVATSYQQQQTFIKNIRPYISKHQGNCTSYQQQLICPPLIFFIII